MAKPRFRRYELVGGPFDGVLIQQTRTGNGIDRITIESAHVPVGKEDPPGGQVMTMRASREDVYEDRGLTEITGVTESTEDQLERFRGWPLFHTSFPQNEAEKFLDDLLGG